MGKCLAGTDGCFWCGNKGYNIRGFPKIKEKWKEFNQAPKGGVDWSPPKRNRFYSLRSRGED